MLTLAISNVKLSRGTIPSSTLANVRARGCHVPKPCGRSSALHFTHLTCVPLPAPGGPSRMARIPFCTSDTASLSWVLGAMITIQIRWTVTLPSLRVPRACQLSRERKKLRLRLPHFRIKSRPLRYKSAAHWSIRTSFRKKSCADLILSEVCEIISGFGGKKLTMSPTSQLYFAFS